MLNNHFIAKLRMKFLQYRFQICAAILGLLLLASIWISVTSRSDSLPRYQGETAEEWFYGENRLPSQVNTFTDARIAFKAMGTNSIPFLIEKVESMRMTNPSSMGWIGVLLCRAND